MSNQNKISYFNLKNAVIIKKKWGCEKIIASDEAYCGKLLCYVTGGKSSGHLHRLKRESFLCLSGQFKLQIIDPYDGNEFHIEVKKNDVVTIPEMCYHKITCIKKGILSEYSSRDIETDSYRIIKGDSQK